MEEKNKIEVYINRQTKEEQIKTPMLDYATNDDGYMEYITRIFEQPIQIGEVLLDFIQRDLKENSYMIFRFYGFQTLLSKEERNNLLATDINNSDNMKRKMEQLYVKYMGEFKDYKKQIIDIIEFCLFNENAKMKDLTPLERLVVFTSTKDINEYTILKNETISFYGASLIKVLDATYLIRKALAGEIDLKTETVTYEARHKRDYSLGMDNHTIGEQISLETLIGYALSVSDNAAHEMLYEYIGVNNLRTYASSLGITITANSVEHFGYLNADYTHKILEEVYDIILMDNSYSFAL